MNLSSTHCEEKHLHRWKYFSDLLRFVNNDYGQRNPPFYIMALYKSEDNEFRDFILSEFNRIHHQTQNIAFVVCDAPPDGWKKRNDVQYYKELVGDNYNPTLNDYEIDIICRYMDVPISSLPCLVFFQNLSRYSFNCFSFVNKNRDAIEAFFNSLLEKTAKYSYEHKNFVSTMIDLRKEFPHCNIQVDWDETNLIDKRLSNAREDISHYRSPEGKDIPIPKKKPRKLTPRQQTKDCCQKRAQQIWAKKPNVTITDMTKEFRLLLCFEENNAQPVQSRTIHCWINSYAPPEVRKPGRRPYKK